MPTLDINTVRCQALFTSALLRGRCSTDAEVQEAIMLTVREFGSRGCASWVAQEFGDHPETAVLRMRWARARVAQIFTEQSGPRSRARRPRAFAGGGAAHPSTVDTLRDRWPAGPARLRAS